jgi:hypothetical protein
MPIAATSAYFALGFNPWIFALLFFAPDLSFLGYTAGLRLGALGYNALHSYLTPALLGTLGCLLGLPLLWHLALILSAYIGFDRAMGYGLKYAPAFGHTHLGKVGKNKPANARLAPGI